MNTAIIGSGLAGLTAAIYLKNHGHDVTVYERRSVLGGRAATKQVEGFGINLGPHALYRGGLAAAVLDELGVVVTGSDPTRVKAARIAWYEGAAHLLPSGPLSMLKTQLLGFADKLAFGRFVATIGQQDAAAWRGRSAEQWVHSVSPRERVRALLFALIRLTSYVNHPSDFDAEAAIQQMNAGVSSGVTYLDGGWGALVNALRDKADGVQFVSSNKVEQLQENPDGVTLITAAGHHEYDAVVVATGAKVAAALLGRPLNVTPVRAASLTLALSSERPRQDSPLENCTLALGIDQSSYYSAHHDSAQLAPDGGQLIHVLRYLPPNTNIDSKTERAALEALMDEMQPGWHDHVVHAAFQPNLVVCWDTPLASRGGLSGRTPVSTNNPRIMLAGDWVGADGHLADAAFASGKRAAQLLLAQARQQAA